MTATVSPEVLHEVALTAWEYERIVELLGRQPNRVELGIFGAMWSEHCSYKTSKPLLQLLPTEAPYVLQGPGENAGAIDIGGGWAVVFKIESHNHPSAIEPHAGAATGVGGILRDIFTMGAFPIATLDSLRFGPLDNPRNRFLFNGVVGGIGDYGNCFGVPTVGGEIYFEDCYTENPLVNAMAVGLIRKDKLMRARASGSGNLVMVVGADTGRDGIHGATFASVELDETSEERRPAVQVGNPFLEKLLMEACLELIDKDLVVAMQDLGAAGLTSASVETADRGGVGMEIDVNRVARREAGMDAYEVMLSESQERMLVVVDPERELDVNRVFRKYDLHADEVGKVTRTNRLVVRANGAVEADIPIALLTDVPLRHPAARPPTAPRRNSVATDGRESPSPADAFRALLGSPNLGSRRGVFRTYDHQVQNNTVVQPGGDAAVLRIKGTSTAIAVTTDGNSRYCRLDPRIGAQIAVAEAARNVVATGASPMAVTNCLNFGNPEKPEIFWQLKEAVDGLAEACRAFELPVVSGNVSLYNDSRGVSIDPTPVIGLVGLIDDIERHCAAGFRQAGDMIVLLGDTDARDLGGSEFQRTCLGIVAGPPPELDIAREQRTNAVVLRAIGDGLLKSAHDLSDGGLGIAIAEACLLGNVGARCDGVEQDASEWLFTESQARFLVSCEPRNVPRLRDVAKDLGVRSQMIGLVGGNVIEIGKSIKVGLDDARNLWERALS
jgi:phosphoribosylformylglycinamidine synthase